MDKIISTLITVVVAVAASAAVWVGANLLFNLVRRRWNVFSAISGGALGFGLTALLRGNRLLVLDDPANGIVGIGEWLLLPLAGAAVGAVAGLFLASVDDPNVRRITGAGVGVGVGAVLGALFNSDSYPAVDLGPFLIGVLVGAGAGAGIASLRGRPPLGGALVGGAVGVVIGGWGGADIGDGSIVEAIILLALPLGLIGLRVGLTSNPDITGRAKIDQRSRGVIFLAPSLLFIFAALVVPTMRTFYLSVLDNQGKKFVQLKNYVDTFQDDGSFDTSEWTNIFTSRLFIIGLVVVGFGAVIAARQKAQTGKAVELGGPAISPLLVGGILLLFAAMASLRGTIFNNIWWVATVTFASTALGLAIAVLAERAKGERIAKSLIFMPMAISLVGASIIWRFMYVSRNTTKPQTGVLNALWIGLGKTSTGSGIGTILLGAVFAVAALALLGVGVRALVRQQYGAAPLAILVGGFLAYATVGYFGDGIGGLATNNDGERVPTFITFLQEQPFNNLFLMIILIWIQTGFAMVILSAAIKAVPEDLLEAARVDGANESQIFWRITLPQIATTIGVVVTTLIVLVMKVYDIVKVTTNSQFDTRVLANDMFNQAFQFGNIGRGAALAVLIFISVLPVMVFNIRKMQEEA